jgi:hypothetical protein
VLPRVEKMVCNCPTSPSIQCAGSCLAMKPGREPKRPLAHTRCQTPPGERAPGTSKLLRFRKKFKPSPPVISDQLQPRAFGKCESCFTPIKKFWGTNDIVTNVRGQSLTSLVIKVNYISRRYNSQKSLFLERSSASNPCSDTFFAGSLCRKDQGSLDSARIHHPGFFCH